MSHLLSRRQFLTTASAAALPILASDDAPKPKRLLDCHLHINHLKRSMQHTIDHIDATGTTRAFVLPLETGGGAVRTSPDVVLEAKEKYGDKVIPFCHCDLKQDNAFARIAAYKEMGCVGIGEQKDKIPLNNPRLHRAIAMANEYNWPMTIHFQDSKNGYNQGIQQHLEPILKKYPRVRIIGHAQSFWANISADVPDPNKSLYPKGPVKPGGLIDKLLADYPNLYADMSAGSGFNGISRDEGFAAGFLDRHRKKLLFGSDCPCWDGKGLNFRGRCYNTRLQAYLRRMVKDSEALDDIFFNNAMRALKGA